MGLDEGTSSARWMQAIHVRASSDEVGRFGELDIEGDVRRDVRDEEA